MGGSHLELFESLRFLQGGIENDSIEGFGLRDKF